MPAIALVSHPLCPYVQRAAITLIEKETAFERRDIDLANKPGWFLTVSPLGKTPVLLIDGVAIFDFGLFGSTPKVCAWCSALAARKSVRAAAPADYPMRLERFLRARGSELSRRMAATALA